MIHLLLILILIYSYFICYFRIPDYPFILGTLMDLSFALTIVTLFY